MNNLDRLRKNAQNRDTNSNLIPARIGAVVNGLNSLPVPGMPAWIYVTLLKGDQPGAWSTAICHKVNPRWNLPVLMSVTKDGSYYIERTDPNRINMFNSGSTAGIANSDDVGLHSHGSTGLMDMVADGRLLEFSCTIRSTDPALTIFMNKGWYADDAGQDQYFAGGTIDLTGSLPSVGSHAWVKIAFNRGIGSPSILTMTAVPIPVNLSEIDLAAINSVGYIPSCGIILYGGETGLAGLTDIIDCSYVKAQAPVGGTGGIGNVTGPSPSTLRALSSFADASGTLLLDNPNSNLDINGNLQVNSWGLPASTTLTISSSAVTVTQGYHRIEASSGTTDNLATINGGVGRQLLIIEADSDDTITVKHGTGNIFLNGAADFALSGHKTLALFYDGTNWSDIDSGGSGFSGSGNQIVSSPDGSSGPAALRPLVLADIPNTAADSVPLLSGTSNTLSASGAENDDFPAGSITFNPRGTYFSFKPSGSGVLDQFTIKFKANVGTPTLGINWTIQGDIDGTGHTAPNGVVLASGSFTPTPSAINTVSIVSGPTVSSSNFYWITVDPVNTGMANGNYYSMAATTPNAYPTGRVIDNRNGTLVVFDENLTFTVTVGGSPPYYGPFQVPCAGGTTTLAAGTVTVSDSHVKSDSIILITAQETGTLTGFLRVSARVVATSFTISSSVGTDTCNVAWIIINP